MAMGGRVAEEIIFDKVTTGAGNDIEQATKLARKMVCEWGMSRLGPISLARNDGNVFLGMEMTRANEFSESTQAEAMPRFVGFIRVLRPTLKTVKTAEPSWNS